MAVRKIKPVEANDGSYGGAVLAAFDALSERCATCGGELSWPHDHQSNNSGLDDGPPFRLERKKLAPKPDDEMRDIRMRAWATRRATHGPRGHR